MKNNILVGAISGNYDIEDVRGWIETSSFKGVHRMLLVYNSTPELETYLKENGVEVVIPLTDFWMRPLERFETNTGAMNLLNSYDLVHNVRFLHIWKYLNQKDFERVFITDVRDVYFNKNPFDNSSPDKITATSEVVIYNHHNWNRQHLYENLGEIGVEAILDKPVYNVGVFGGPVSIVKNLCADIYLMSVGKAKVADQTSFNYLIQTNYKEDTHFTTLSDNFAVHLHVVKEGKVSFDLTKLGNYSIIHQYDRFGNEILNYNTLPR